MRFSLLRSSVALAALGAALSANAVTFSDDFALSQTGVANSASNGFAGSGTVSLDANASRTLYTYNFSNDEPGFSESKVSVSGGAFVFSSDEDVNALGYAQFAFATPVDFSGSHDFQVDVLSNDLAGTLLIQAFDADGNRAGDAAIALPAITSSTTLTIEDPFAGIDATRLQRFLLVVGGTPGEDAKIGGIQVVPEPTSVAALGIGAIGLLRRRKRA